jgi:hypothetical protein
MKFCKFCGQEMDQDSPHHCPEQSVEQSPQAPQAPQPPQSSQSFQPPETPRPEQPQFVQMNQATSSFDFNEVIAFIKNPYRSLERNRETMLYGILGISTAILSYIIWIWALISEITEGMNRYFNLDEFDIMTNDGPSFKFLAVTAIVSFIFISIFALVGTRMGENRSFRDSLITLGSSQFIIAVGYLVAAFLAVLSIPLSLMMMAVVTMVKYILLHDLSFTFYNIQRQKRVYFIFFVFALYGLSLWLLSEILN